MRSGGSERDADRRALEAQWLDLVRRRLPEVAVARNWPVRLDHCFARILLDNAVGARWSDHVVGRPAYRRIAADRLEAAIALGEAVLAGGSDLWQLNRESLAMRGKVLR